MTTGHSVPEDENMAVKVKAPKKVTPKAGDPVQVPDIDVMPTVESCRELTEYYLHELTKAVKEEKEAFQQVAAYRGLLLSMFARYRSQIKSDEAVTEVCKFERSVSRHAAAKQRVACIRCTLAGLGWFPPAGFDGSPAPVSPPAGAPF
jgi:hypothetical protein